MPKRKGPSGTKIPIAESVSPTLKELANNLSLGGGGNDTRTTDNRSQPQPEGSFCRKMAMPIQGPSRPSFSGTSAPHFNPQPFVTPGPLPGMAIVAIYHRPPLPHFEK